MDESPNPSGAYALADLFQIRMAGVPFDVLEPLATPRTFALAREVGAAEEALDAAARAARGVLRDPPAALGHREREKLLRAIDRRAPPGAVPAGAGAEVSAYAEAARRVEALRARYPEVLREELEAASRALRGAARRFLPGYSFFASATVEELVFEIGLDDAEGPTRRRDRQRDRTLLMYVQRLATKNETLSAFGPSAWGAVDPGLRGLRLDLEDGLRRHAFLERWVAQAMVAAMNRDPAVRSEIAPRLHPAARLEDGALLRRDSGERRPLDPESRALLERCDGITPAHALAPPERLASLADAGAILWAVEVPAFVVDRVGALASLVAGWRDGEARSRWAPLLTALAEIPAAFEREAAPAARRELVQRARGLLAEVGAGSGPAQRVLYRGSNPVSEDCVRACELVLGGELAREVTDGAAPWLDLWRDTVAFVAHRANAKLRALHAAVPGGGGAVPLPAFLATAEKAGLQLHMNGLPALGYLAFLEVKAAFREAMAKRPDGHVWSLSAEDCAFLRRRFEFPRFEAFTYPSADLQLAAPSVADVEAGRHRWVVAELHLPAVMIQHGIYWGCPDGAAFDRSVRAAAGGVSCDWGVPADITTHTLLHFDPLADLFTYAGPSLVSRRWKTVRPADAEVVVAEDGDVRLRAQGRDLGSFARSWVPALGFHPFILGCGAHTPRLELGRVVVQREMWTIGRSDLPRAPYGHGAELVLDVDRLRAAKGIPRHVYVRPSEEALRRMGAGGRDKDVKPVYVDLESQLFLDVLARWMAKHGELEVAEMLPGPDDLLWREADGRRTFELRTLVVPAPPTSRGAA
jgi:hypothetical protein